MQVAVHAVAHSRVAGRAPVSQARTSVCRAIYNVRVQHYRSLLRLYAYENAALSGSIRHEQSYRSRRYVLGSWKMLYRANYVFYLLIFDTECYELVLLL